MTLISKAALLLNAANRKKEKEKLFATLRNMCDLSLVFLRCEMCEC